MGQRRKNPEDNKLPKNVYRGKYKTYFKPSRNQTIALGPKDMSISETWRQYEVALSELTKVMTFSRLWHSFLGSAYFSELKPRTQKDYLQHQKKLIAVFGEVKADNIKPEHVRTFMDKRGLQSKTQANHEMASMSRVYKWGYERGYVKGNPCAGVMKFKAEVRDRYIADDEYQAVIECADDALFIGMEIAYLCAARVSDILNLRWEQILSDGVFIQQGKTGKKQIKAWTQRLRFAIDKAKLLHDNTKYVVCNSFGEKYSYNGFNDLWTKARKEAGEKLGKTLDFTFHDLKAKGISDYQGSTKDKQLFSGHKTESQVLVYDRKVNVTPSLDRPLVSDKSKIR